MKLGPFIIDGRRVMEQRRRLELLGRSRVMLLRLFFVLTLIAVPTYAQRIAIPTPENKVATLTTPLDSPTVFPARSKLSITR